MPTMWPLLGRSGLTSHSPLKTGFVGTAEGHIPAPITNYSTLEPLWNSATVEVMNPLQQSNLKAPRLLHMELEDPE